MADKTPSTPAPVKKWCHPFQAKGAAGSASRTSEVSDPQVYFDALAAAADGFYPVGANGLWHGGIHFDSLTAVTLAQDAGIRCIADGEVIAYRIDSAYPGIDYPSGGRVHYSRGFVLVKHRLQLPPKPGTADASTTPAITAPDEEPTLTLFSLYMHLLDWSGYEAGQDLVRPAFWADARKFVVGRKAVDADPYTRPAPAGRGINVRQTGKGSARIGWLPPGTAVAVEAGNGDWRRISSIDSGRMSTDPVNVATGDAPLGWIYTRELDSAPSEPKIRDAVVVLDKPVAINAGELIGHLGQYGRYADRSAMAASERPLAHIEVFSGDDVQGFIDKSKARGTELDAKQKTLLVIDKGTTLVLPTEPDQSIAAGADVKLTDDSPKGGQWAKVESLVSPAGEAMWVERALLNDKGQRASTGVALKAWSRFPLQATNTTGPTANHVRVAAIRTLKTTAIDDKGVRWWEIDVDAPDAKGNTLGWVCETGRMQSPWEWPGFKIVSDTATLTDLHGKQIIDQRTHTPADQAGFQAMTERAQEGELFRALYDAMDTDKKDGLTTEELRAALRKPWLAQTLSRVIARYESEWGGEIAKWDALDDHMGDSANDWKEEKGRIKDLQWWQQLRGQQGHPDSPIAHHFHPIGLVANFIWSTCYCDRDLTENELKDIVIAMRKSEKAVYDLVAERLYTEGNISIPEADKTYARLTEELNRTFSTYGITSCIRKLHFLAQVYWESDRLRTTKEYGSGHRYAPYIGRGLMQLTWREGYEKYESYSGIGCVANPDLISNSLRNSIDSAGWYWRQGKELSVGKQWTAASSAPVYVRAHRPEYPKNTITYTYGGKTSKYGTINLGLIADDDYGDVISWLVNGGGNGLSERRVYISRLKEIMNYESCHNRKK